ncbi:MAG: helicase-exonuclease AddAB subunit AddB [Lachnospiraceae bacterium]|nr:helicase-exonuclease AddAB subunit AddB [Lachnospiraceae bacterium]
MALKFVFGGSGSGKSTYVFDEIISRSLREEDRSFFILVPDQFTMQTQMDLVRRHPKGGIMNIDVLSFGRLAHRIMEEAGGSRTPVLDDTGKSLVLRRVAGEIKEELPVLGSHLKKLGYIHQVKSAISEFMQYGIGEKELEEMLLFSEKRGSLYGKLQDLKVLYTAFEAYLEDRFITTEETYDRLAAQLATSRLIRGSVVVLDGFTGFTPIQNRVILELLKQADEVIVTLTMEGPSEVRDGHLARLTMSDLEGHQFRTEKEEKRGQLFALSRKTKNSLERLAKEAGEELLPPVYVDPAGGRFGKGGALAHLEKNLFALPMEVYDKELEEIRIYEAATMEEEVRQVCRQIRDLLERGCCYRDIALITADMEAYSSLIEEYFTQYGLPYFLDKSRKLTLNPFIEYIRSALQVITSGYSYEAMFHYLRSGMVELEGEEIDSLENYVLAFGIKGKRSWNNLFVHPPGEEEGMNLEELNRLREKITKELSVFTPRAGSVRKMVEELYAFLVANRCQEKLVAFQKIFADQGDRSKEKEYAQIYRLVMDLLDQLVSLLGEEKMGWEEFAQILDAGFGEIQVGIIPQAVDRILVGDMERTRLSPVKALFFLGVNEGKIPRATGKGGILSDLDREFLEGCGLELAPTPRSQLFIQKFYLYLNVTKPSEGLYLSYARLNEEGKTMKPSYFIGLLEKMYVKLEIERGKAEEELPRTREEMRLLSARMLSDYGRGKLEEEKQVELLKLLTCLKEEAGKKNWVEDLLDSAFFSYGGDRLTKETARLLYGAVIYSSVSRLEKMASCAYAHFLQYGLSLKERQEYGFEVVDMGNVYHGVLEIFARKLAEKNYTWISFPEEEGRRILHEALENYAVNYGNTVLFSSARYAYGMEKMERILWRTVSTLRYHLQAGSFVPREYELSFSALEDLDAVSIQLSEAERLKLGGRIDRLDTYEEGKRLYVKVMDYKSGNHDFKLAAFYHGLQLQLVVYLNAALELEKRKHPDKEVVPAAFLYYHIDDPMVKGTEAMEDTEIEKEIRKALRVTGVINSDEEVLKGLDGSGDKKSQVIRLEYTADGSVGSRSATRSREQIQLLLDYSRKKAGELGRQIGEGEVSMNPKALGKQDACTWCAYKNICSFDERLPGFTKQQLEDEDEEILWQQIREELAKTEEQMVDESDSALLGSGARKQEEGGKAHGD